MAFKVVHDGTTRADPAENCCFCWKPTRYWHARSDVAVCQKCAETHKVSEIPTKATWCKTVRDAAEGLRP